MAIPLPATTTSTVQALTPRQIVAELDKHVVGQGQAKRAVAIALRNRSRRQKLPPELAEEVAPKNILMIGPTGVGKTEFARRLHTVMEKLLDEISFEAPDLEQKDVTIDEAYVDGALSEIVKNEDLSRYIL